jgi:nucleoid-associated protein YgaU
MKAFERYVLVSMLVLVVAIVAVLAWDGPKDGDPSQGAAGNAAADEGRRSGDLGVAPVQRDTRTSPERKPAPSVDPRALDVAQRPTQQPVQQPVQPQQQPVPQPLVAQQPVDPNPFTGANPAPEPQRPPVEEPPVVALVPNPAANQPANPPAAAPQTPAAGALPTGPLVVRKGTLSDQLAAEYGRDYKLFGPNGLVAAFEEANPGLDPTRLSTNAELVRPPAERIAAARRAPAVVVDGAGGVAAAPQTPTANRGANPSAGAALPEGARPLAAVNVTPTVDVAARTHTVQAGETASAIAQKYFGKASAYRTIALANPGVNIERIVPGQVLVIPTSEIVNASAPAAGAPATVASNAAPKATGPRIK